MPPTPLSFRRGAGGEAKGHSEVLPAVVGRMHGIYGHKGILIVSIGHHAHLEEGGIRAAAVEFGPEADHQVAHGAVVLQMGEDGGGVVAAILQRPVAVQVEHTGGGGGIIILPQAGTAVEHRGAAPVA